MSIIFDVRWGIRSLTFGPPLADRGIWVECAHPGMQDLGIARRLLPATPAPLTCNTVFVSQK